MKKIWTLHGTWQLAWSDEPGHRPQQNLVDATVPGDVTMALSAAGVVPRDLFYRDNLKQAKWVEERHWWYRREFSLAALPRHALELVFDGIDLFATVWLNGQKLGETTKRPQGRPKDLRDDQKTSGRPKDLTDDQKTSGFTFYLQPPQEKLHFRINANSEPADVFADVEGRTHVKVSRQPRIRDVGGCFRPRSDL